MLGSNAGGGGLSLRGGDVGVPTVATSASFTTLRPVGDPRNVRVDSLNEASESSESDEVHGVGGLGTSHVKAGRFADRADPTELSHGDFVRTESVGVGDFMDRRDTAVFGFDWMKESLSERRKIVERNHFPNDRPLRDSLCA